jgi:hypothetical protein
MRIADHAVCLSIDHRYVTEADRIRQTFAPYVGELEFFIDGAGELLPAEMYDQRTLPLPPNWTDKPGAFQHLTAMKTIAQHALDRGWDSFLFIEDDCVLSDNFELVMPQALADLATYAAAWDMFYLGAMHCLPPVQELTPNLIQVRHAACLHCVVFRRTVFAELAAMPPDRADMYIGWNMQYRFAAYAARPDVAFQKPGYSYFEQKFNY